MRQRYSITKYGHLQEKNNFFSKKVLTLHPAGVYYNAAPDKQGRLKTNTKTIERPDTMNTNEITFKKVRRISEYRCQYPGQLREQNAFFTFTMDGDHLCAQYDGEIGNAIPFSVYYGFTRRYSFNPYLKMGTVNRLGEQILPLVRRVLAGMSSEWDGDNNVCRMTEDAYAAEAEIQRIIDRAQYNEI